MPLTQGRKVNKKKIAQESANLADDPGNFATQENREKYWNEINADEKIERVRTLVKSLVNQNDDFRRRITQLENFIWEHTHSVSGETVVKITKQERYKLDHGYGLDKIAGAYGPSNNSNDNVYI